jgi:hypothetical protein
VSALFDLPAGSVPTPEPNLSADRRRTQLQAERIAAGYHPLAGRIGGYLRLHPDAPRDHVAPGPRCGTCWYRAPVSAVHGREWAKCTARDGTRTSHSAATDIRAWWPACTDYSPGDQAVSRDAARWTP